MAGRPGHLPAKLTITLWDFSWYTMSMPGEPFHDLAKCFDEAVERGYNTVRICAMPFLLFDPGSGRRRGPLKLANLGRVGMRTRWYNCRGGAVMDGFDRLLALFREAERHQCFVILSSWEYQQSFSFLGTRELYDELMGIPPQERFMAIAKSMHHLVSRVKAAGYGDRIAYVELHNEIEYGGLNRVATDAGISGGNLPAVIRAVKPYTEEALAWLGERHPDLLFTGCFTLGEPWPKDALPGNMQVGHFHMYINGVLQQLMDETGIRNPEAPFPNPPVESLLRDDAPPFDEYRLPEGEEWRLEGNPVGLRLLYLHDWCDPVKWDLYLYEHYGAHKLAMKQKVDDRFAEIAAWAADRNLPVVIGEGYVGYTPLLAGFEESPVGKDLAEHAIRKGMEHGFWGMVLCSNCAPHHPFWADIEWQRKWNDYIRRA